QAVGVVPRRHLGGHLRPLLLPVPHRHRRVLLAAEGRGVRHAGDVHPVLLRLRRHRRSRGRRGGGRAGHQDGHRRDGLRESVPDTGHLGHRPRLSDLGIGEKVILDPSGRGATARQLTMAGIAMIVAFALVLGALALRYTGYFEDKVAVHAELTSTGDGLPQRADVKFRGMVVGRVDAVEVVAKGQRQRVDIHLRPDAARTIPANVTARVIPNNIFGVSAIELVDNGRPDAYLSEGAVIAEDTSGETMQLQTTLTVLRDVLENIQPAKLGRVLATLAAALDPASRVPGSTVERLDRWITEVRHIPGVGELLGDLGAATTALSQSAPELVGVLT